MTKYIEVVNGTVDAQLAALAHRTGDVTPFLLVLGEDISERTKERFGSGTDPDGVPWKPNSPVTLAHYIQSRGGKSKGAAGRKAQGVAKKPLIGPSHRLSSEISYAASESAVAITSPMPYAFMQQFGGTKGEFPHLWGDIPARPYFPIKPDGSLYPSEVEKITDTLRQYLTPEE